MAVSVVIPTRNNLDELRVCLDSLGRQTVPADRILICVDGSTDGTLEFVASLSDDRVMGLTHPGNVHRAWSATRNLALPHVLDGYVLFLDSDMRLDPRAIEAHLAVAEREDAISVGAVVYENVRENLWSGYLMQRGRNRYRSGDRLPWTQFTTQNALVPAAALVSVGGFDEGMTTYGGEDTELAIRLMAATGRPMVYNPDAGAFTWEPKTWQFVIKRLHEYGEYNLRYTMAKHPDLPPIFELGRRASRRPADRFFVAMLHPLVARVVRAALPLAPRRLQYQLLKYEVVRAVHEGYLAGSRRAPA
jgi:GT2 family glycosyltransferase